jgi:hypothetical protein
MRSRVLGVQVSIRGATFDHAIDGDEDGVANALSRDLVPANPCAR